MTGSPSLAQVRAQVRSIREKARKARAIAIGLPALDAAEPAPETMRIGSEELPVFRSGSVLALRERLVDLADDGPPLVVLTDLPETELGHDLLARFAHRRVFCIEPWQLVKDRFLGPSTSIRAWPSTMTGWRARSSMRSRKQDILRSRAVF